MADAPANCGRRSTVHLHGTARAYLRGCRCPGAEDDWRRERQRSQPQPWSVREVVAATIRIVAAPPPSCLPEDGFVDDVAVARALRGDRAVRLTPTELHHAVRAGLDAEMSRTAITKALAVPSGLVDRLADAPLVTDAAQEGING